jgi:hypothetical protein
MLIAWSVTEVIRYTYFALSLAGALPTLLTWVRYSTFFVLYPMGITSECMLVYAATGPAAQISPVAPLVLYAILAIYVPGAFLLLLLFRAPCTWPPELCAGFSFFADRCRILYSLYTHDEAAQQGYAFSQGQGFQGAMSGPFQYKEQPHFQPNILTGGSVRCSGAKGAAAFSKSRRQE